VTSAFAPQARFKLSVNQSKCIFRAITKYYNVLHASAQKAAREALRSLNWTQRWSKFAFPALCTDDITTTMVLYMLQEQRTGTQRLH